MKDPFLSVSLTSWIHEAALNCYTKCPDAPRFGDTPQECAIIDSTPERSDGDTLVWYFHAFLESAGWNYIRCVYVRRNGYELKKFYSGGGYSGVIEGTDREDFFEALERLLK